MSGNSVSTGGGYIFLMWVALLGSPPAAFGIFQLARQSMRTLKSAMLACALVIIVIGGAIALKIEFTVTLLNTLCVSAVWFSYCFLAASTLQIKVRAARWAAVLIAFIPVVLGYVMGTIGVLGLMFILADYTRPPENVEQMKDGLACETSEWGMVASAEGKTVALYQAAPFLPFIRRKVASIIVNYTAPSSGKDATCADALAKYESGQ